MDVVAKAQALLDRARAKENAGDPAGALALLDAAPKEMSGLGSLHYARGALLFRKGDLGAAEKALREAVRLDAEVPEYAANLGAVLIERARRGKDAALLDEAIALLEGAAARGPRTALPHNNLGMAYQAAGRYDDALAAFEAAIEVDENDVAALYNRAATLHLLGREEECLAALDRTLAAAPDFEPARRSREGTLKRLGR